MNANFDVIVVGGRPAGASLAARLGAAGLSVLVVDKASLPSAPEVPSCPVLYPAAMRLLDEIGLPEERYAHASTPVRTGVIVFDGYFSARMTVPPMSGRDHVRGIDRAGFDAALWDHLAGFATVTRRDGFRVDDVVRAADGRVVGVTGAAGDGPAERITARLAVVGADGRHSPLARKVDAKIVEDRGEHTSSCHFAEWEGVAFPGEPGPVMQIVTRARGEAILFFPTAGGRVHVATHVRSDRADPGGDAQAYYAAKLASFPSVHKHLAGARQVGPLRGVRKIANRYREAGGPGWLLVGDAVHHKDPVDGQGIHDALIEARRLAELLALHHRGALGWDDLVQAYTRALDEETRPMFRATMKRLARELYQEPPAPVIRTVMRWLMQDPEYHRAFFKFLGREADPERWLTPSLVLRAAARGLLRDLGLARAPAP